MAESSFHRDCSLLVDDGAGNSMEFPDIADSSFREIENISLDNDLELADELIRNQIGAGQDDYNMKLVNDRTLKDMKAVDVNYQLTFNNNAKKRNCTKSKIYFGSTLKK